MHRKLRPPAKIGALLAAIGLCSVLLAQTAAAGTLDDVRARGRLICGVSDGLPGFSEKDKAGAWHGFDVDFCKAVAAAVLGDTRKVDYRALAADDRFAALKTKQIDLLARNTTWTMSRDLGDGLAFAGIDYFDGQGFMLPAQLGASSPLQLEGASICVVTGTAAEENAAAFFARRKVKVSFLRFKDHAAAREAYASGKCDAFTGDRSALAAERARLAKPEDHVVLEGVISKEPLGPVTRKGDEAMDRSGALDLVRADQRRGTGPRPGNGRHLDAAEGGCHGAPGGQGAGAAGRLAGQGDQRRRQL